MIYVIIGTDTSAKDDKIKKLRNKLLPLEHSRQFDYDTVDGQRVDASTLKQILISLPALSDRRVVLIRQAHKLTEQNQKVIDSVAAEGIDHTAIIMDFETAGKKLSSWFKKLPDPQILDMSTKVKQVNVWDVTKCIPNNPAGALSKLNELYDAGNHPLKIMGGLVWFWGSIKNRVGKDSYKKGLLCLQEADLNIKRSRIKSEYALEVLILKLCSLAS